MLKNYLKIAFRNIRRQPGFSAINVGGLAIGLASCLLISLYISDELRFDQFNQNFDRLYRVVEVQIDPQGDELHTAYTAGPVGPAFVQDMPEVEKAVRLAGSFTMGRRTVEFEDKRFYESDYLFAEPDVFELFDFTWVQGDPTTALRQPNEVVLTRKAAMKYFGSANPVGKSLHFETLGDLVVTGILGNTPANSHLDFNFLISYSTLRSLQNWYAWLQTWDSSRILTYVLLRDPSQAAGLQAKIPAFMQRYQTEKFGNERKIYLQAVSDIHFKSAHIESEQNNAEGNLAYIYIFGAIAAFLLLIGCVNYVNLATAQAMKRAREVGVRKALGAHPKQLVAQFLGESGFVTLLAAALSLGLVVLTLPFFNQLTQKQIELNLQSVGGIWLGLAGMLFIVWFVTGGYPAFYLSRFRPVSVLKGQFQAGTKAVRIRQMLVVAQFSLSIALVIGTIAISNQLDFIQNKELGYKPDAVLSIDINSGNARSSFRSMKSDLERVAAVEAVSVSSNIPGDWKDIPRVEVARFDDAAEASFSMHFIGADSEFLSTYEITLSAGRNFSEAFGTDSTAVILNQSAANALGVTEPSGQLLNIPSLISGSSSPDLNYQVRVIGIVEDFHFLSLHQEISPLVIGYWSNPVDVIDYFTVKVQTARLPDTIAQLQLIGEKYDPEHPFEYNFVDERLNDFYQAESRISLLFSVAASLAVFIACLGLLGLAAFSAEQRIKEIGVRKVLGASLPHIIQLMTGNFLKLVVIAFFIGAPLAFIAINQWLEAFAYRTTLGVGTFAMALILSIGIAFFTVLYQSLRAGLSDPVKTLRCE